MVKEKEGAAGQETSRDSSKIVITVLFTTHASTARALDAAIRLAKGFDTSIEIIVPEIVPFALELDHPATAAEAIQAACLNYQVDLVPLFTQSGVKFPSGQARLEPPR